MTAIWSRKSKANSKFILSGVEWANRWAFEIFFGILLIKSKNERLYT